MKPLRILCCLNRDLASSLALNLLLPALAPHDVRFTLTEQVGNGADPADEPWARRELRRAEQWLPNRQFFPLVERAALPADERRFLTFREIERLRGIASLPIASPNAPQGLAAIRAFAPDLILTIRYGAILKAPVIGIPPLGVLNLHSGLLPAYRGVLATFRALANGDERIGCTLHWISDGSIDTGDIVDTCTIPVERERSLLAHVLALYPAGIALMSAAIEQLAEGRRPRSLAQSRAAGAYYTYPTAAEWADFLRQGWRIVDAGDLVEVFQRYLGEAGPVPATPAAGTS